MYIEMDYRLLLRGTYYCDIFFTLVDLQNGQVLSKTSSDVDDKWKPWTPRYIPNLYAYANVSYGSIVILSIIQQL